MTYSWQVLPVLIRLTSVLPYRTWEKLLNFMKMGWYLVTLTLFSLKEDRGGGGVCVCVAEGGGGGVGGSLCFPLPASKCCANLDLSIFIHIHECVFVRWKLLLWAPWPYTWKWPMLPCPEFLIQTLCSNCTVLTSTTISKVPSGLAALLQIKTDSVSLARHVSMRIIHDIVVCIYTYPHGWWWSWHRSDRINCLSGLRTFHHRHDEWMELPKWGDPQKVCGLLKKESKNYCQPAEWQKSGTSKIKKQQQQTLKLLTEIEPPHNALCIPSIN